MYKALPVRCVPLYEEEVRRRRIRKRLCSAVKLYAHAQFNFYIVFLCNGIHNIPLLSAVTEKRVSVPETHKNITFSYKTFLSSFLHVKINVLSFPFFREKIALFPLFWAHFALCTLRILQMLEMKNLKIKIFWLLGNIDLTQKIHNSILYVL